MRMLLTALAIPLPIVAGCGGRDSSEPTAAELDERFISKLVEAEVVPSDTPAAARPGLVNAGRNWRDVLAGQEMAETGLAIGAAVQVYCPEVGARFN